MLFRIERPSTNPEIKCGMIDLNNIEVVRNLVSALSRLFSDSSVWHRLEVKGAHFITPDGRLASDPGWYVISDQRRTPIYVGQAGNLNRRLNSENGSRDGFLDPTRLSDPERNIVKTFRTMGYIICLSAGVIRESDLLQAIDLTGPLEGLDRDNVEKTINIFRHIIVASAWE